MARLRRKLTGEVHPVPAHALIGRSPACFVQLDLEHVSKEHAVIAWRDGGWRLRDLGSRNGTYLDGRPVEPGVVMHLVQGSAVAFGRSEDVWILTDDRPPEAMALHLATRTVKEGAGGLLALPDDEAPLAVVLQRSDGGWAVERTDEADEPVPVRDRETLAVDDGSWCLLLPEPQETTPLLPTALGLESVLFRFGVSQDEERVKLTLVAPHREVVVQAREFNYVLLTLARARRDDRDLPIPQRGWIDREVLLKMLRMRTTALNVAIHRARQHLLAAGLVGAAGVVEVRRRARRFGSDRIDIRPLEE